MGVGSDSVASFASGGTSGGGGSKKCRPEKVLPEEMGAEELREDAHFPVAVASATLLMVRKSSRYAPWLLQDRILFIMYIMVFLIFCSQVNR